MNAGNGFTATTEGSPTFDFDVFQAASPPQGRGRFSFGAPVYLSACGGGEA